MPTPFSLSWLPFLTTPVPAHLTTPFDVARFEARRAAADGLTLQLRLLPGMGEGWQLTRQGESLMLEGGSPGILYGVYAVLMAQAADQPLPEGVHAPQYPLRMIDCWDNASGDIERGYAGRSLWFEGNEVSYDPQRLRQLARMLASVGLNVLCINNVNVRDPAHRLIEDWLPQLADMAAIFRPFGVHLMVSVDYAQPLRHGIPTADPLDVRVQRWWQEQAQKVWDAVPDLIGFLVKADSEHRPGPFTYGRNHAEGANMLARAIRPYGGVLVWRCFVYNCQQDWRDTGTDRPMAAYEHYVHLDGQFDDNVILQVKHGPFDFQVREPLSPTLLAMPRTNLAIEFQLAQEYTGQQIDLYAMPPLWRETCDVMGKERVMAIAAVSNLGRDACWTGHPFAAVNLFGFGLFAWNPDGKPEEIIRRWARLTYHLPETQEDTLVDLLMHSREIYEKYTSSLGLGWMVNPNYHYGPSPDGYEFQAWGTYHRASRDAVGIDRTSRGTGYTLQYPPALRDVYENPATCPENLLLFFHRLRYDTVMADGRTLIQRLYDEHFDGAAQVEAMAERLGALELPEPDRTEALSRMRRQIANAREWRDVVNTFFHRLSGAEDAHGRKIYD